MERMQAVLQDFSERIRDAAARQQPLRLRGGGTKDFYGQALHGELLDTRALVRLANNQRILALEDIRDALLVPAAALVREKAAGFLFLLTDGKANRVPVKYGFNDGSHVEILDGVPAGARVVIPGKIALTPGQAVTAVEAK